MAKLKQDINKITHDSPTKRFQEFNSFWNAVYEKIPLTKSQKNTLQKQPTEFRLKTREFDTQATEYRAYSKTVAVSSAIRAWLEETLADAHWKERYATSFAQLYKKNLIPFFDANGGLVTLEYFESYGHQDILEAIRCVSDWSLLEKEEIVRVYVEFSQSLARQTRGIIPDGFDPDRERVRHKAVKYEAFIDFVNHLSERDALIAKLLYFGAMTIEEVIALGPKAVNANSCSIIVGGTSTDYPKHLILDILTYIGKKEKAQKILFSNVRGEHVERAHLNQSFARACEKMSKKTKITPGSLLKLEHESKGSDNE